MSWSSLCLSTCCVHVSSWWDFWNNSPSFSCRKLLIVWTQDNFPPLSQTFSLFSSSDTRGLHMYLGVSSVCCPTPRRWRIFSVGNLVPSGGSWLPQGSKGSLPPNLQNRGSFLRKPSYSHYFHVERNWMNADLPVPSVECLGTLTWLNRAFIMSFSWIPSPCVWKCHSPLWFAYLCQHSYLLPQERVYLGSETD